MTPFLKRTKKGTDRIGGNKAARKTAADACDCWPNFYVCPLTYLIAQPTVPGPKLADRWHGRGWKMPIERLLAFSKLSPEQQDVLKLAFDNTLGKLNLVDRDDPICEIVARKIIEVAAHGASDPIAITETACRELRS